MLTLATGLYAHTGQGLGIAMLYYMFTANPHWSFVCDVILNTVLL